MIHFPRAQRVVVVMRWVPTILVALTFCAAPLWLWGVPLRWFFVKSDDFAYVGLSRTAAALSSHLVTPHNGHVAPLFLLETHLLARVAGSLERLPAVLGWASCATLVMAMLATGHVAAWETGRPAIGLAAMAAVGLTSVMGPTVLWYAAGQALAAGTMIMLMLAAIQLWRACGPWWTLALALIASIAAPLFWSAGYAAGLVAMAYLWADGRRACRRCRYCSRSSRWSWLSSSGGLRAADSALASHLATQSLRDLLALDTVVVLSAQAVCEALVLNNLGLDAATTAVQGLCFGAILVGIWGWSRRRSHGASLGSWPRVNPLEAAGAVLVAASFGLIFAGRGVQSSFDGLRTMGWYDAMAELGAVLFALGWWCGPIESPPPRSVEPPGVWSSWPSCSSHSCYSRSSRLALTALSTSTMGRLRPSLRAPRPRDTSHRRQSRRTGANSARCPGRARPPRTDRTRKRHGWRQRSERPSTEFRSRDSPSLTSDITAADLLDLPDREAGSSRSPGSD